MPQPAHANQSCVAANSGDCGSRNFSRANQTVRTSQRETAQISSRDLLVNSLSWAIDRRTVRANEPKLIKVRGWFAAQPFERVWQTAASTITGPNEICHDIDSDPGPAILVGFTFKKAGHYIAGNTGKRRPKNQTRALASARKFDFVGASSAKDFARIVVPASNLEYQAGRQHAYILSDPDSSGVYEASLYSKEKIFYLPAFRDDSLKSVRGREMATKNLIRVAQRNMSQRAPHGETPDRSPSNAVSRPHSPASAPASREPSPEIGDSPALDSLSRRSFSRDTPGQAALRSPTEAIRETPAETHSDEAASAEAEHTAHFTTSNPHENVAARMSVERLLITRRTDSRFLETLLADAIEVCPQ